jgi:hypothetical protein
VEKNIAWSFLGAARCSGDGSLVIPTTFVPEENSFEIGLSVWLISLHTVFYKSIISSLLSFYHSDIDPSQSWLP